MASVADGPTAATARGVEERGKEPTQAAKCGPGGVKRPQKRSYPLHRPKYHAHSSSGGKEYLYLSQEGEEEVLEDLQARQREREQSAIVLRASSTSRTVTVGGALIACLNLGIDPPDQPRHPPCAREQCWFDPSCSLASEALKIIGDRLQTQYQIWQPRARYRQLLDPTASQLQRDLTSLRRSAQRNRVMVHYNGHGVPRPSMNGEIWCFNSSYTKYIPISLYELQTWCGMDRNGRPLPSLYVFDCANTGRVLENFRRFLRKRRRRQSSEEELYIRNSNMSGYSQGLSSDQQKQQKDGCSIDEELFGEMFFLGACDRDEDVCSNPDLPADLFTACLLTPVKAALRWFVVRSMAGRELHAYPLELLDYIPGADREGSQSRQQRNHLFGALNWVLTSILDAIAYDLLPPGRFRRLFRQDVLVASLFRNFLLAVRIGKDLGINPVSVPSLPNGIEHHRLWQAWDWIVDESLQALQKALIRRLGSRLPRFLQRGCGGRRGSAQGRRGTRHGNINHFGLELGLSLGLDITSEAGYVLDVQIPPFFPNILKSFELGLSFTSMEKHSSSSVGLLGGDIDITDTPFSPVEGSKNFFLR